MVHLFSDLLVQNLKSKMINQVYTYILLVDKKTYCFEKVCCGSIRSLVIHGFSER